MAGLPGIPRRRRRRRLPAPAFAEESFDFYGKTLAGQKEMKPRWKRVLDSTKSLGMALGELYRGARSQPEAKRA